MELKFCIITTVRERSLLEIIRGRTSGLRDAGPRAGFVRVGMSSHASRLGSVARAGYQISRIATAVPDVSAMFSSISRLESRRLHTPSGHYKPTCINPNPTSVSRSAPRGFAASAPWRRDESSSEKNVKETTTSGGGTTSGDSQMPGVSSSKTANERKLILYKGPLLLPFRLLVRFKIFQLAGFGAAAAPLSAILNNDPLSTGTAGAVAAVVGGSVACSLALQYYASRYVGEMALLVSSGSVDESTSGSVDESTSGCVDESNADGADKVLSTINSTSTTTRVLLKNSTSTTTRVRLSTMDFWGRRFDATYDLREISPPLRNLPSAAYVLAAQQVFIPLDVTSRDRNGSSQTKQHVLSTRYGTAVDKKRLFQVLTGTKVDAWPSRGVGAGR